MATDLQATQVDLAGLMSVLGGHLYSTPAVAVRELVQNAHDSIMRRRIEDPAFDGGRIDVLGDPATGTLTVRDDGAGMTRDEIDLFLATVGVGYTRGLREQSDSLIGQFGLGFLSAFIIGERTAVRTALLPGARRGLRVPQHHRRALHGRGDRARGDRDRGRAQARRRAPRAGRGPRRRPRAATARCSACPSSSTATTSTASRRPGAARPPCTRPGAQAGAGLRRAHGHGLQAAVHARRSTAAACAACCGSRTR